MKITLNNLKPFKFNRIMLGPWENNEIYTLRHSAESGDRLSNVIPLCQESSWDLQMREKRKGSSHKGERACAKAQRHETAWVYEKCTWNQKGNHWVQKRKSLRRSLGPCYETWNSMICCHPHVATHEEAFFHLFSHSLLREASRTRAQDGGMGTNQAIQ